MKKAYRILAINAGSTSTKIGIYDDETALFQLNLPHNKDDLLANTSSSGCILGQKELRKGSVMSVLNDRGIDMNSISAVVGRAGRLPPMPSGTYNASTEMMKDIPNPLVHVALLSAIIAHEIGQEYKIPSFFVDPTNVDEVDEICRVTGIPEIRREIVSHCLNQKAVARRRAKELGKDYNECDFVVVHMGGGISLGAHHRGRMIDVVNPSNGEGPMSPERAGLIPSRMMVDYCFREKRSESELKQLFLGTGGLFAHTGSSDFTLLEKAYTSNRQPEKLLFEAMAYQISKCIGAMAAVLFFKVDSIILTGGLAFSTLFTQLIENRVGKLAPVIVYPGEDELQALAMGALRVLRGEEAVHQYISKRDIL